MTDLSQRSEADATEPTVARNTGLAIVTQVVTAGLTAVLFLYLTRALGPTRFGVFGLAAGIAGILLFPADLGISPSVGRFIAEHRRDRRAAAAFLSNALPMKLLASLMTSGALIIFGAPVGLGVRVIGGGRW